MATYYKITCDDLRESIDPGRINDCGVKLGSIAHPGHPLGMVTIFALSTRWSGHTCGLVSDVSLHGPYWDYADVTENLIARFNETYPMESAPPVDLPLVWG